MQKKKNQNWSHNCMSDKMKNMMIVKTIHLHLLPRSVTSAAKYEFMARYLSRQNTIVNRNCTLIMTCKFLYESRLFNTHCMFDNLSRPQHGYENLSAFYSNFPMKSDSEK